MSRASLIRLLVFLGTAAFIVVGTVLVIRYAEGYRPTRSGFIKGTGLLAANSFPSGAEVYINSRLTTATDNTLNLDPGVYDIAIRKDGYHDWEKKLTVTSELVTQTNAQLFPTSPTLEPLTFTGAVNPVPSPDGLHIAFTVASASAAAKNGLYVVDLNSSPLIMNKSAHQIARTSESYDYQAATYTWSPNSSELLVAFKNGAHVLLPANSFTDLGSVKDVTATLPQTWTEWELELAREEQPHLAKLPDFMAKVATASATNLYFSPDGNRLLYQAVADFTIPENLIPPLPASSTQIQARSVKTGGWYVYDLKEDRNFLITEGIAPTPAPSPAPTAKLQNGNTVPLPSPFTPQKLMLVPDINLPLPAELGLSVVGSQSAFRTLQTGVTNAETIELFNAQYSSMFVSSAQWYPDSAHIVLTTDRGIDIMEYDGTNRVTVYSGPFDPHFVYPWPDGSSLVTRIQFSPDTTPDLYTIKLK